MGTIHSDGVIINLTDRTRSVAILGLRVDTGSERTWIDGHTLETIGIAREKDVAFVMANGRQITRHVGHAIVRVGEDVTIDEVVFAEPGDAQPWARARSKGSI